jgi:hypothetical protein
MKIWKPWMLNVATLVAIGAFFVVGAAAPLGAEPAGPQAAGFALISYQGTLTNASGTPLNETPTMEFALYDAPTEGNLLWGPETQAVDVQNGLFHVLLGSVEPMAVESLIGTLYLDVKVNGELLLPREEMASLVGNKLVVTGNDTSVIEGNLKVGDNAWVPDYAGMHDNDLAVHGTLEQRGAGGTRVYKLGVGVDPGTSEGTIKMGNILNMNGQDVLNADQVEATVVSQEGNKIQMWSGATPAVRVVSENSIHFFIDSDNNATAQSFTIQHNNSYFSSPVSPIFQVAESGAITAYGTLNMNGHSVTNCGAVTEANLQTAEELAAGRIDRFEEGDVLCWAGERLERCRRANDRLVQAVADTEGRPIVIGAEAIKVLGPVHGGDLLVASDVAGYATVNNDPPPGTVIAQALEDLDGDQGIIKAMIRKF